jgi:hypothetical protein
MVDSIALAADERLSRLFGQLAIGRAHIVARES